MANNLDSMLLELEKQVQDFTMSMADSRHANNNTATCNTITNENEKNISSDDIPLQAYKERLAHFEESTFKNNAPLQRSATSRKPTEKKLMTSLGHSKSLRSNKKPQRDDPSATSFQTNEELQLAMQKWPIPDTTNATTKSEEHETEKGPIINSGFKNMPVVKTLVTRIYIDNAQNHKTVQLTNLLTTAMIIQYLKKKGLLDNTDQWTLFEIANSHGVERPFREWEIVLDVVNAWEPDAGNALLVKKYPYHYTLTPESLQMSMPSMYGWISIEYKKGKWQKRFCFIKDNTIYHAKDNKGSTPSVLCHLTTYDVYTLLQSPRSSPTSCVFVIRSQDRSSIFEKESDYIRFLAVEDQEEMKNWVLSVRAAKSHVQYQNHPHRVMNPLAPVTSEFESKGAHMKNEDKPLKSDNNNNSNNDGETPVMQSTLRRHKSTKELRTKATSPISDELVKQTVTLARNETRRLGRSATTSRGGLGRSATMGRRKNTGDENMPVPDAPLVDCSEPPTFAKGSLLAKEEEVEQQLYRQQQQQLYQQQQHQQQHQHQHQSSHQYEEQQSNQNTLIQIDDRVTFAKGSLLDKKENPVKITRSKSERDPSYAAGNTSLDSNSEQPQHRRHVSLRRKPTGKSTRHHDVPLPNTTPITSPSSPPPPPAHPPLPTVTSIHNNNSGNNSGNTLLRLDVTPETFHSRELKGRHVKPLVNFDSDKAHHIRK